MFNHATDFYRTQQSEKEFIFGTLVEDGCLNTTSSFMNIQPMQLQSEAVLVDTTGTTDKEEQKENLTFADEQASSPVELPTLLDPTYDEDKDEMAALATYLSRPVLIQATPWTQTGMTNPVSVVKPWYQFFSYPMIQRKCGNYSRLHCKLHLKFVLNASPFFYGAMRVTYEPRRTFLNGTSANVLVPASQTPGVWLTPSTQSSAELVLPFISEKNWINPNLINDLNGMGTLSYYVYSQLQSANGATGQAITISCYAWAEDVTMCGPTYMSTLQSETKSEGKISGLANKVAGVAGKLGGIPFIGTYAKPAQMAAKAVGSLAAAFGYSNSPVTDDVKPYCPKAFHAFANCETRVPNDKLCIDPKNEQAMDNQVCGTSSEDPLALSNFLRESYIGQFTWDSTMATQNSLITCPVAPSLSHTESVTQGSATGTLYSYTPMAYAARMFSYWRGSIIYRFKIIKTPYHKGRIRFTWDPAIDITLVADTATCCFTKLIDLDDTDEVEFEVPFKAQTMFLKTDTILPTYNNNVHNEYLPICNGFLNIDVQNVLTGPIGTASIQILIFQRPGEDFRFAQPKELPIKQSPLSLQSATVIDGKTTHDVTHIRDICFGEDVESLRCLLHRSSLSFMQRIGDASSTAPGNVICATLLPRFPPWYGFNPQGIVKMVNPSNSSNAQCFLAVAHPMQWLLAPFVGVRGSVVCSVNVNGASANNGRRIEYAKLERYTGNQNVNPNSNGICNTVQIVNQSVNWATFAQIALKPWATGQTMSGNLTGQRGMTLTKEVTQSAISAVSPQYLSVRFRPVNFGDPYGSISSTYGAYDNFRLDVGWTVDAGMTGNFPTPWIEVYYAGGVDMQPVFFVCTPALYDWGDFATPP